MSQGADFGPFAVVVGYGGVIIAAGGALFAVWGGRMREWRPPDEDLPKRTQKIALLLCGISMVFLWYYAPPETIGQLLWIIGGLVIASIIGYLFYSSLLGSHVYIKKVATNSNSTQDIRILGGRNLLPEAEKTRKEKGIDIQGLFEGAAYNPDLLWSRQDRQSVKVAVILSFILTLVSGTSALTGASFATQVILTKKAASSVVRAQDAPGLKDSDTTKIEASGSATNLQPSGMTETSSSSRRK